MPHDGQDLHLTSSPLLANLLDLTGAALPAVDTVLALAKDILRAKVSHDGRVSGALIDQHQTAAHGLAWLATYAQSLHQMQDWALRLQADGKFGEVEQLIHQIAFGEYLWQIYGGIPMSQGEIMRPQDIGLSQDDMRAMMVPRRRHALRARQYTGRTDAPCGPDAGSGGKSDRRGLWP